MKWIKRIFIGIVSVYLIALGLDMIFSKKLLETNLYDGEYNVWNDIHNHKIDESLLIYGSSRSYVQVNPKILDKQLAINSYNMGLNGQKIKIQKFRSDYLLSKGYTPKNVIINLDIDALQDNEVFWVDQYLVLIYNNIDLYNILKKELNLSILDVYVPLYRYRNYNVSKSYIKSIYNHIKLKPNNYRYKGFKSNYREWTEKKMKSNPKVNLLRKQDLLTMIEDLQEVNSNVILINSPEFISQIKSQKNRNEIIKLYNSLATQYNIPFIDYSNDSMNFQKQYFYDSNHLNAKGADIFTKKLAEDIKPFIKR